MTTVFLITAASILVYMTGWFIAARISGRNDIADVAWGLGFILAAAVSLLAGGIYPLRGLLVLGLVLVWGVRLALHIHNRNRGRGEDPRYRKWREEWGKWFVLRSFLQVFMLQGMLLLMVAMPVIFVNQAPAAPLGWLDLLGLAIWLYGFGFEAIGDWQLLQFICNPDNKGKLMTSGLWRYTRHPNYFGEVTLWWGIWLMGLSLPGGWLTVIGPLTITFLILKVSGIPMLEKPALISFRAMTLQNPGSCAEPSRRKHVLAAVSLQIQLPDDFPEKYREAIIRVAELCAVKRAILHPPQFSVQLG